MNADDPHQSDIERLVAFHLGELSPQEEAAMRRSIATSQSLAETAGLVERVAAFLREETHVAPPPEALASVKGLLAAARPGLLDRIDAGIRRVIAALEFDTRHTPAVAGLRGGAGTAQVAFTSAEGDIDLEIDPEASGHHAVRGVIDADEDTDWTVRFIYEMPHDTPRADSPDTTGERSAVRAQCRTGQPFRVALAPGRYTLIAASPDAAIEAGPITVP